MVRPVSPCVGRVRPGYTRQSKTRPIRRISVPLLAPGVTLPKGVRHFNRESEDATVKKLGIALLMSLFLLGCASGPLSDLAHENQSSIIKLTVGMTRAAVIDLMGTKSAPTPDGLVANPFRSETFQDTTGARYEVLYYATERNRRFQPLRLSQTTPLILKNDVLIGWGTQSLRQAKEQVTKELNITIER